ncbi:hypothetical protein [Halosolutus gelatinilyticus]|nr:hypothetical protein [Halosolutus gelatinilyticus]
MRPIQVLVPGRKRTEVFRTLGREEIDYVRTVERSDVDRVRDRRAD